MQVENLGLLESLLGQALHALALTYNDLRSIFQDQICMQVYSSFSRFGHTTQVSIS